MKNEKDVLEMFGLTKEQAAIMYSIQELMICKDIENSTKEEEQKKEKRKWLNKWKNSICTVLNENADAEVKVSLNRSQILNEVRNEINKEPNNKTWYYIMMLECALFTPYYPFAEQEETNQKKKKRKLKYKRQTDFLKKIVAEHKIMDDEKIDRFVDVYTKTLNRIQKKGQKIAINILAIITFAAVAACTAALLAPQIAVALVGSKFALSGAALTNAALALIGGGAIAAGGAGIAGGVAIIAGGGALLGGAMGGTGVAIKHLLCASPEYALSQAAKLEVVLKEIILNAQKDVKTAQNILKKYKEAITDLSAELAKKEIELNNSRNEKKDLKEEIKKMKKTIEYLKNGYKGSEKFTSSFEVGMGFLE